LKPFVRVRIALTMRDRSAAGGLDEIEQGFAALLLDDLPDQYAEPVHIVS
jgi:hypothetical protein